MYFYLVRFKWSSRTCDCTHVRARNRTYAHAIARTRTQSHVRAHNHTYAHTIARTRTQSHVRARNRTYAHAIARTRTHSIANSTRNRTQMQTQINVRKLTAAIDVWAISRENVIAFCALDLKFQDVLYVYIIHVCLWSIQC